MGQEFHYPWRGAGIGGRGAGTEGSGRGGGGRGAGWYLAEHRIQCAVDISSAMSPPLVGLHEVRQLVVCAFRLTGSGVRCLMD